MSTSPAMAPPAVVAREAGVSGARARRGDIGVGLRFALARPDDDAALRQLLREGEMPGAIRLSFEREPSYFRAAALEGPIHQTGVGRDPDAGTDGIVAVGSRSVRLRYVNGRETPVGYLSQFRISPSYARKRLAGRILRHAFDFCRELHEDGRTAFYLMAVVEDNIRAGRLLASGLPGYPHVREHGRMTTHAIAVGRSRRRAAATPGITIERGSPDRVGELLDCLDRNGRRRQFSPVWAREMLFDVGNTPGLAPRDFWVASRAGRVAGCLALWDQRSVRQTVVRGYAPVLARFRPVVNIAARLAGWPRLPRPGQPIRLAYLSHVAVDDDDTGTFAALLRAALDDAARRDIDVVVAGFAEGDPLESVVVRAHRTVAYRSRLYLVAWEDGLDAIDRIDGRTANYEVALL
ncbi:MAG TPA: GNAT family N-acetyltransferase [Longimicrobiales bacterium]|nr:GNAT family N-acetyltransferase [Longimicrobiales bacterium]